MFYLGIYIWDRKWGLPLSSGLIVRMSHPVSVTSRVCSNSADLFPSCKENMLKSSPVLRWHKCAVTSYFLKSVKRIQIVTITGLIYKREPLSRHMFLSLSKAWGSSEGKTISFTLNYLGLEYIAQNLFHTCVTAVQLSGQISSRQVPRILSKLTNQTIELNWKPLYHTRWATLITPLSGVHINNSRYSVCLKIFLPSCISLLLKYTNKPRELQRNRQINKFSKGKKKDKPTQTSTIEN